MKSGYTHISFVLDRSGSMASIADDTIGGFNTFIGAQQRLPGEATITLVQFDDRYEPLMRMAPLAEAQALTRETFVPRGSTALLDAIGRCMRETGEALAALPEESRPEHVVFVILTDGMENASREYDRHKVSDAIAHQRDVYSWQFVFLGANQDAIATAAAINIGGGQALTYAPSQAGTQAAFAATSDVIGRARAGAPAPAFTEADRKAQADAASSLVRAVVALVLIAQTGPLLAACAPSPLSADVPTHGFERARQRFRSAAAAAMGAPAGGTRVGPESEAVADALQIPIDSGTMAGKVGAAWPFEAWLAGSPGSPVRGWARPDGRVALLKGDLGMLFEEAGYWRDGSLDARGLAALLIWSMGPGSTLAAMQPAPLLTNTAGAGVLVFYRAYSPSGGGNAQFIFRCTVTLRADHTAAFAISENLAKQSA